MVNPNPPQALLKVTLKKIPTLELVLDYWWAHQDLNLGLGIWIVSPNLNERPIENKFLIALILKAQD